MTANVMEPRQKNKYLCIREWVKDVGWLTEGGIRHLIYSNPEFNRRVVRRLGKKILLDCEALEQFIDEQHA